MVLYILLSYNTTYPSTPYKIDMVYDIVCIIDFSRYRIVSPTRLQYIKYKVITILTIAVTTL